jgi:glycosyltransferase involved in cell wall biosynthesis
MPRLSIITVNYNQAANLQKTFDSVFCQTFTDYEYIVIDGGSTDGSKALIEQNQDKLTYWVSEKDKGIYNAMNKGIAQAKGEYCYFLNSGDRLYNATTLADLFSKNITEEVVCGKIVFASAERQRTGGHPQKITFSFLFHSYFCHQAVFFKTSLFNRTGVYDESFKILADWALLTLALAKYHASYRYLEDVVIAYYDTSGISSQKQSEQIMQQEKLRIMQQHFPVMIDDMDELQQLRKQMKEMKSSPRLYKAFNFFRSLRSGKK